MVALSDLHRFPLLQGVDEAYLQQLCQHMYDKQYDKKQPVVRKGDVATELLFLLSGQLQVVDFSADGKEVGLYLIEPGEVFGHMALIDELPRSTSVLATQVSSVVSLPKTHALKLFYDFPVVMHRLLIEFANIIRNTNSARSVLSQNNANARVYSILVSLMRPNVAGMLTIEKMPRQQDLAIMANTSRETVSRAIGHLVSKGIVEKDLRCLIIRKPDELSQLSDDPEDA